MHRGVITIVIYSHSVLRNALWPILYIRTRRLRRLPADRCACLRNVRYGYVRNNVRCGVCRCCARLCIHPSGNSNATHSENGNGEEEGNFRELHVDVGSPHYSTVFG